MSVTEQMWKARETERAKEQAKVREVNEQFLKQSVVHAAKLTGQPEWDRYLGLLQTKLDEATGEYKSWLDRMKRALSSDDLRVAQIQVCCFEDRIQTLLWCMSLPKHMVEHAHELGLDAHPHA